VGDARGQEVRRGGIQSDPAREPASGVRRAAGALEAELLSVLQSTDRARHALRAPRTRARALLAYERAYLRGRHHWFTAAAEPAAAANPLLRPLARAVAFTIERWADEEALYDLHALEPART
jgi:hypothetical protein